MASSRRVSFIIAGRVLGGVLALLALSFLTALGIKYFTDTYGSKPTSDREPASVTPVFQGRGELEPSRIFPTTAIYGDRARLVKVHRAILDQNSHANRTVDFELFPDTTLIVNMDPASLYGVNDGVEGTLFTGTVQGDPESKVRLQVTRSETMSGEIVAFGHEYRIIPAQLGLHLIIDKKLR